ncbi:MAG: hypothetical protein D6692_00835 [Planctomycetota bacterium]|nr:MAG: hypothetical protein D6692_00835 [Planctomycetota bacterium]
MAAYNMLAANHVAYIADEVGMGKTYVALGVLGLLRHVDSQARAMIIAPRENIQRKWVKELSNFVRVNWRVEDNRFKNLHGAPVRPPVVCDRLHDLAFAMFRHEDCDPVLRMTTFSVAVKDADRRKRYAREIREYAPWLADQLRGVRRPEEFITRLGFAINGLLPELDLLIIDEAHNLRHGFGPRVSNRNRLLAVALGHADPGIEPPDWYRPKARRVLMLSATPFECDYADIYHQLDVLGQRRCRLSINESPDVLAARDLIDGDLSEADRQAIVQRFMLRRVGHLNIAGEPHSKNMYRREWRRGGYSAHDQPMALTDERQRLVVALIQKKVTELLGEERFKNCFQIGMLSSFESFLESLGRRAQKAKTNGQVEDDDEATSAFDLHEQTDDQRERQGVDTSHVEAVAASYRDRFNESLPHPKLDATCSALSDAFVTGEKALVFVRRVATVDELKAKLDRRFDAWIHDRMRAALPSLAEDVDRLFDRYRREQRRRGVGDEIESSAHDELDDVVEDLRHEAYDDEGGIDTFFAWFFRGKGPSKVLSGAAMQKNRFASASTVYSTFFEDDFVAGLLGHPRNVLRALAERLDSDEASLVERLRRIAFAYYEQRTRQKEGYPRLYVYEAYQVAALALLARLRGDLAEHAAVIIDERFDGWGANEAEPPARFPAPSAGLGIRTFVTELQRRPRLREALWPEETRSSFRDAFRRREQRRELLSAMCRLGASYIDLYLTAIGQIGSFESGRQADSDHVSAQLAGRFLDRLEEQRGISTFGAYAELGAAASAFDTIVAVNFPDVPEAPLNELPDLFARTLQHQLPVAGMSGGVNKRVVQQFRMPGFPLVLVTTDVLQEGEDLHTFCRRVIHYGIAWTPSSVEQRTGRVDRIGSLVQRELEGRPSRPDDDELIQVYYPHLTDTIEVLQVRRVLERINKFLRLSHRDVKVTRSYDSRLNVSTEVLRELTEIPRITELLQSAFDDTGSWLDGDLGADAVYEPPVGALEGKLGEIWTQVAAELMLQNVRRRSARLLQASALVHDRTLVRTDAQLPDDCRQQAFTLKMRSQVLGDETLVRCASPVGRLDLRDANVLDQLYDLQRDLGDVRVCARHDARGQQYIVSVEEERLFHLSATQTSEIRQLIERTVVAADVIEQEMLAVDAPVAAIMEASA